jgi:hypothetical protein
MAFGAVKSPPVEKKPFNINDVDTSANQEAVPVPYGAGVFKCTVDWIAPPYNQTSKKVQTSSGKKGGGDATAQKEWYSDIAGITNVCADDAPNDAILYILVNDEIALKGPLSRAPGTHYVDFSVPKYSQACRFYWGTKDQPIDTLVLSTRQAAVPGGVNPRDTTTWPRLDASGEPIGDAPLPGVANPLSGHYDFHPAYRNQGLFVARQWYTGSTPNAQSIVIILARGTAFFAGARFEAGEPGVNPMGPQFEAFTDDLFGFGVPAAKLSAANWQATADAFDATGFKLAPVRRNASTGRSFIAEYNQNFDGWLRRNGALIEAGFFRHGDIDVSALPELNSDDLAGEPNMQPGTLADTKNCFFVTYTNRTKWYKEDDTDRYIEQSNFSKVERQTIERFQRPDIIEPAIAVRVATEFGAMLSIEPGSGKMPVLRRSFTSHSLNSGELFKSDVESVSLAFVWRLMSWDRAGDRTGTINLKVDRERSIRPSIFIQQPAPKPQDFIIKPAAISNARIVDLPSALRDLNSMEVAILAERPANDILGFKIYVSLDDDNYDIAAVQHHFASFGKVATSYPAATPIVDTAIGMDVDLFGVDLEQVTSQSDQQRDDFTLLEFSENEIMSAGAKSALGSGRYNILQRRACYGSLQATHPVDAPVWFVFRDHLTPIAHSSFQPGATVHFKFVPFTYGGDYDIDLVESIAHVFGDGPFLLSGLELAGQGNDHVFTGRDPKFAWRIFSTAGAEISGPELSLGAWDDQFAQFNLRVRDATSGAVVWTGSSKVPEYVFDFEQNARCPGGPRRTFHFEVAAQATDTRETPWLNVGEPFENTAPAGPGGSVISRYDRIDVALNPVTDLDYAGFIVLRHKTDPAFAVNDAGVEIAFLGPGPTFFIPQPEATTWYYRSAPFDAFTDPATWPGWPATSAALYALLAFSGDPVPFTTLTLSPTIAAPPIDQGPRSFVDPFDVNVTPPAGMRVVYSFNRNTNSSSSEWPGGIGSYSALTVSVSCTLYWRGYDASGTPTMEGSVTFILVNSHGLGDPSCAQPSPQIVSGKYGHTPIHVELPCTTPSASVQYNKNGAGWTAYTVSVVLSVGDSIEFNASAPGYVDSPTDYFENPDLSH